MVRVLRFFLCLFLTLGTFIKADVLPIQSFKTPSDIEVWLVEDHTSPIVSLVFTFKKTMFDSPFTPSALLFNEALSLGAGVLSPLEMNRFSKETPTQSHLQTRVSKNYLLIKTTKEGLASSLNLWTQLTGNPHFEKANLDYIKAQTLTSLSQSEEDLELNSHLTLMQAIFPASSFQLNFPKTREAIKSITIQDLEKETLKNFLRVRPKVVVVGDVNKKDITTLLDSTFGTLALKPSDSSSMLKPTWTQKEILIEKDISQSTVSFAQSGVDPHSKDYPKFLLLQNVLAIRFFDELRNKRGLIYSISFNEHNYENVCLLTGYFACECKLAKKILKFIRSEWERLKDFGMTQQELSEAKRSFKRDKILNLTSTEAVANEYTVPLAFDLVPNAAETLLESTEKMTLEEMNQFVNEVLTPESLTFVLIGPSLSSSQSKGKK